MSKHTIEEPISFSIPALKPCPFCGSAPVTEYVESQHAPLLIRCPKCTSVQVNASVVGFKSNAGGYCDKPDLEDLLRCVRIVVKMWNKRFAE